MGRPVEGPERCTSTTTQGISANAAKPMFSCLREKPGPEVAVMDLTPATDAPMTAAMLASSSSIWMNLPPTRGSFSAQPSAISVEGVMG